MRVPFMIGLADRAQPSLGGSLEPNGVVWFWIGSHSEYDKLVAAE
jgi:hypothetical protein